MNYPFFEMLGSPGMRGSAMQGINAELRRAILTFELPPGGWISEKETAIRFGLSRTPVHEALLRLSRTRLVEVRPQHGAIVAKISLSLIAEAGFVLEAIEGAVVRRASEEFDSRLRERVADLISLQAAAADRGELIAFQQYDEMFHHALALGAGCPIAWNEIQDIKAHMDRVGHLALRDKAAMAVIVDQHRAIMAGVDAKDADAAVAAQRDQLHQILSALPGVEAAYPEYFVA